MDPCPFARIVISNLAFYFPNPSHLSSLSFYSKFKFHGFPSQVSDVPVLAAQNDAVDGRIHASFTLKKIQFDRLAEKPTKLIIEIYTREINGCAFVNKNRKFLGRLVLLLELKNVLENHGSNRASLIKNGWVPISGMNLHLNVKAEPDPRFVFQFDGEPECSPQVFQINGSVKQPVFTCKFRLRNPGEINSRSRCSNSTSESGSLSSCLGSLMSDDNSEALKERKGWSVTIHDLSGSPVAAASMVTPFVPSSRAADKVSRSNPGAWLILRPGYGTWRPWARLEAWREGTRLCYRFELVPNGGSDAIQLANSSISTKTGGKFSVDITNGPTPMASPNSSFDFSSGWGSGSDLGSASGSGSWAQALYRGFVMSSTVEGGGRCSRPVVEVGVQHVTCTEDAAAFVALAAAMDLSMDACRLFSKKLRKELRQPDLE